MRYNRVCYVAVLFLLLAPILVAQATNATINGRIADPTGRPISDAGIVIVNDATRVQYPSKTNNDGIYAISNLPPGVYRIQISKVGFKTIIKPDITLNVEQALSINFTLPVGAASESVTVEGGAPALNTESAAVSTVIDKNFVQSLPLNGRSFNTLLQLTPGVVIAPSTSDSPGEFSISGQRTSANNFIVDGVSANFGVSPSLALGQSGAGASQAFSVMGGTSSLVSVEDLQEFRVETSSFAPEFGKTPGGQVILTTRSGTNDLHGGLYEYFRNNVLDANDWFANELPGRPHAAERFNNFGGYLGGRIQKDRTFFFVSYEGARLRLPQTEIINVPSLAARASATAALAPYVDAYPLPNGAINGDVAKFTGVFSSASELNAGSVRIDHQFGSIWSLFTRFNDAPSNGTQRLNSLSDLYTSEVNTKTLTLGLDGLLSSTMSNAFRTNFSSQTGNFFTAMDSFGGATPLAPSTVLGSLPDNNDEIAFQTFDTAYYSIGPQARNRERQLDFNDDLMLVRGSHRIKVGGDERLLFLDTTPYDHFVGLSVPSVQALLSTGQVSMAVASSRDSQLLTQSLSLYSQDTWSALSNFTVTYGVRWELSPSPAARGNTRLTAWENVFDPAAIAPTPAGSAVWDTKFANFAPRLGIAYSTRSGFVIRAGTGIFYDLGEGSAASLATSYPNVAPGFVPTAQLPLQNISQYFPPISFVPPFTFAVQGFNPDLRLPRSYQWNLALEKSLGGKQTISATYVGQIGKDLLRQEAMFQPNANFDGDFLLTYNGAWSKYDALQLQYRRPLSAGVQVLLNYTYGHSRDNSSNDVVAGLSNTVISAAGDSASSDFDIRHSFSGAVTFDVPQVHGNRLVRSFANGWSLDTVAVARTGFPFNATDYSSSPDPEGYAVTRPDLVPDQPLWIANPGAPGGQSLNSAALSIPTATRQGTEPRNDIPGFGLVQVDASLGRKFRLSDRVALQFRADAFNLLNHPNFTNPQANLDFGPGYLSSTQMLNQGLGGLNPLFQEGGPRSLQLSLKLSF